MVRDGLLAILYVLVYIPKYLLRSLWLVLCAGWNAAFTLKDLILGVKGSVKVIQTAASSQNLAYFTASRSTLSMSFWKKI